ncbi:MAG: hypothetical protein ABIR58_08680, partial [Gemmatimonadaceae bacterium]
LGGKFGAPLPTGVGLSADQRALFRWMNEPSNRGYVVLARNQRVGYLATVYTPLRSWYSHPYNTPYGKLRRQELDRFYESGVIVESWRRMPILIVFEITDPGGVRVAEFENKTTVAFRNGGYLVVKKPLS